MIHSQRIRFVGLDFDPLSLNEVLDDFQRRSAKSTFDYLVTPNVDHIVRLHDVNGRGSKGFGTPTDKQNGAFAIAAFCRHLPGTTDWNFQLQQEAISRRQFWRRSVAPVTKLRSWAAAISLSRASESCTHIFSWYTTALRWACDMRLLLYRQPRIFRLWRARGSFFWRWGLLNRSS